MCNYHDGDEAIYWKDENNNVFIDSRGEMLITAGGIETRLCVKFCPMCGKKFEVLYAQTDRQAVQ